MANRSVTADVKRSYDRLRGVRSVDLAPGLWVVQGARNVRRLRPEHHLMKSSMSSRRTSTSKKQTRNPATATADQLPAAMPRPAGKLGLIMDRLAAKRGATADELVTATGWQRHSVLGALSRLRSRGFMLRLEKQGERKAYRLQLTSA